MTSKERNRENYLRRRVSLGAEWFRRSNKESYERNKEKTLLRQRTYYRNNREKVIARTKEYQKIRPEIRKKALANFAYRHPEKLRIALVKYRCDNRDKLRLAAKTRYWRDRDRLLILNAEKRNANREYYRSYDRKWRANPENRKLANAKSKIRRNADLYAYRATERIRSKQRHALKNSVTVNRKEVVAFYQKIKLSHSVLCFWCGDRIAGNETHIDHIVALSKGGLHAVENLCASCPCCNLSKGAKSVEEWEKYKSEVLYK